MPYTAVFRPGMGDLGPDLLVRNSSLLRFCEDTAGFHCDSLGAGLRELGEAGAAWVLLAWQLAVYRRPRYGTALTTATWARQVNRVHSWRDFSIRDEDGGLLAEATSRWIVVRNGDHAVTTIPPEIIARFPVEPGGGLAGWKPRHPEEPEAPLLEAESVIRTSDTDMLGHLHNLNYIRLAEDMLPPEEGGPELAERLMIQYRGEVRAGDTVRCLLSEKEGLRTVTVMGPSGISAEVSFR